MGQYWQIVNLDYKRRWPHPDTLGLKLGEFFWNKDVMLAVKMLTEPKQRTYRGWSASKSSIDMSADLSKTSSRLLQLPPELIRRVFDHFEYLTAAINLCLAHDYLGQVGEPVVEIMMRKFTTPWINCHIACLGDSTQDDDYPAKITPYVAAALKRAKSATSPPPGFIDLVQEKWEEEQLCSIGDLTTALHRAYSDPELSETIGLKETERARVGKLIWGGVSQITQMPPYRSQVLCNLTKGEYVRADAVDDLGDRLNTPSSRPYPAVTLGQALLSKICWSSSEDCAMICDFTRLTRGPWAGDSFRVTSFDQWNPEEDKRVWRDISDEVVQWLEELWRSSLE